MPKNHLSKIQNQFMEVSKYEMDENDNIYFNIEIRSNDDQLGSRANYSAQRTIPIINDASKYYASIIRFNIPNFYVPLHVIPIQPNQSDVNLTEYSITLEYNGDVQQVYLDYVSNIGITPPLPPDQQSNGLQANSIYYFMYEYQQMANFINTAFETAFNNLATKPATVNLIPPSAPIITFNERFDNRFSIVCQKQYYEINNAQDVNGPIKIYFNGKLWTIINGFSSDDLTTTNAFTLDGRDYQILVNDYYKNTNLSEFQPPFDGDYFNISQQFSTIFNWNPFKRIIFVSNNLPISGENVRGSGNSTLKVLTDFSPYVSQEVRTVWQYTSNGENRLIDMNTRKKITDIDLQVFWVDRFDNLYPVFIPWGQEATIKLAFYNKKLYKNYISRTISSYNRDYKY
jgi:hypothetical protein